MAVTRSTVSLAQAIELVAGVLSSYCLADHAEALAQLLATVAERRRVDHSTSVITTFLAGGDALPSVAETQALVSAFLAAVALVLSSFNDPSRSVPPSPMKPSLFATASDGSSAGRSLSGADAAVAAAAAVKKRGRGHDGGADGEVDAAIGARPAVSRPSALGDEPLDRREAVARDTADAGGDSTAGQDSGKRRTRQRTDDGFVSGAEHAGRCFWAGVPVRLCRVFCVCKRLCCGWIVL